MGKEVCHLVYIWIYIPKRVQSRVVLYHLGYLCSLDLSVYMPRMF